MFLLSLALKLSWLEHYLKQLNLLNFIYIVTNQKNKILNKDYEKYLCIKNFFFFLFCFDFHHLLGKKKDKKILSKILRTIICKIMNYAVE